MRELSVLTCLLSLSLPLRAEAPRGYYRFPDLHGDTLVFAAEGDLWTAGAGGGPARRLTTHAGEESHPAISPDGATLAFTAAYEGPTELYVMPTDGGRPTRLTYDGASARRGPEVAGWTPGGRVLFATAARSTLPDVRLLEIDPKTADADPVPLYQAADGVYDAPDGTLFFTRQAFQGSHAKRYRGGTAQSIWKFTEGSGEAVPLTADYPGTSRSPMWWNGRVYFVSDRDGTANLWSMDPTGGDLRQHTSHRGWDVKDPSLSEGRIVYQAGADLHLYDIASDAGRRLEITLASDFDQTREKWIAPTDYWTETHLSPDGDRVVLTARGEVFVAPVGPGRFVHVTRRPGVRYRRARFLPDGESLVALSDESGEVEWWRLPADGVGEAEQWTSDGHVLRYDGVPSPDGRWIVSENHHRELWLIHVPSRRTWRIASSPASGFSGEPSWSADSRWFAYSIDGVNRLSRIYLAEVDERRPVALTTDRYDSVAPAWSPDGRWIYFLSDRHFQSLVRGPWGARQPDPFFDRETRIYAVALVPDARWPFEPPTELDPPPPSGGGEEDAGEAVRGEDVQGEDVPPVTEIALGGLAERLFEVPVAPGNYRDLSTNGGRLYWIEQDTSYERRRRLLALDIDRRRDEPLVLAEDVADYELARNGEKLLVVRQKDRNGERDLFVIDADARPPVDLSKEEKVDLSGWTFPVDPREEWRQMFVEAWRLHRDYFYDRDMHGVDWPAMREKYLPLVDRVTSRSELSDLLAHMVSELSALHASVRDGDPRRGPDQIEQGFLGAVLERDHEAGGYRIVHIHRGDPDLPGELSPLARPGIGIADGDVIVTVNGVPTLEESPGALLRNQAGRQVRLGLATPDGTRDVIVVPIDGGRARDLRYDEWERSRRQAVEERGGGRIGYVHLRSMGGEDIADWQRDFFPVFHRQGLVIDVRHNRGGNIDSWILGKLLRRSWMYWQARWGEPYWNMQMAFRGHLVVLVDEWTRSDGEAFAEGFRRLGLGPVIGTRTWGGEVWLTSQNVLVDNGIATAAEFGVYGPEGEWLIEGHGVEPDIEVDNLPHATFRGGDAQLDAAIEHLLERIREDPRPVPPVPPYPDKSMER